MYSLDDFLREQITPEIRLLTREQTFRSVPVESISVQEFPVEDFIQKDELVLSTAIGCMEQEEQFLKLVEEVSHARAAAMILTFKDPAYQVPPAVISYADSVGLPLFVIPWAYRFSEIQRTVLKRIQDKKLECCKVLQTSLFDLFFESRSLDDAADLIADTLQIGVSVVDKNGRLLAESRSISDVPPAQEVFREMPVCVGTALEGKLQLHGQLVRDPWMAAERSNDLEKMLCFPLSLWFNRKNIEDMVETRLRNDFVWNLANKNYASVEEVTAQGSRLHFDLNCPYTCMVMKAVPLIEQTDHAYSAESAADTSAIKELLIEAAGMERLKIMVADRSLEFIIYLENTPERAEERIETYLNTVDGQMAQRFPAYRAHWGISEITVESPDFAQLYKNAALALSYCMNSSQRCYRFTYRDTKDLRILSVLSRDPQVQTMAVETAGVLRGDDTASGMDLMGTLMEFLNCNYNISQTARNLHIHRQSLLYRLEKIEALTELSLSNHKDLFLLEICARILSGY